MLWIWQLSHLWDSEAILFRLGSKARLDFLMKDCIKETVIA